MIKNEKVSGSGLGCESSTQNLLKEVVLTPAQTNLLEFFRKSEISEITEAFKLIFKVVAFDSHIFEYRNGQQSIYELYTLIEVVESLEKENNSN